jgi:hypothetical protein
MPSNADSLDLSQPKNDLSSIAESERRKLYARNDYAPDKNLYSSTNPDAMATGDEQGKGTGRYLDVYDNSAGNITDVAERKSEIVTNYYQPNKPYTVPTA